MVTTVMKTFDGLKVQDPSAKKIEKLEEIERIEKESFFQMYQDIPSISSR